MGQFGIRAGRVKDAPAAVAEIETKSGIKKIHSEEQFKWMSENSPFLRWVRRSCLGYDDSAKTYQSTDADWILNSPQGFRHAFMQGISDGDGGVSKRSYYFSISTHSDHDMIEGLFAFFGIKSYRSRTYVRTSGFDAVKKAAEIQPFRHAQKRISNLEETVRMLEARRRGISTNPLSSAEISFMIKEREVGKSFGEINELLYSKFGYTLDTRTIRRLTKRRERG